MQFYQLERLINLHDGYRKQFKIDHYSLLLLQLEGRPYLIESQCPHREFPLSAANVSGEHLVCPQHGYRFDIRSGDLIHATEEPCRGLRRYELVYRDNVLGVML
ncbi:Rieske 2Fe-2S domain-containing protein [Spongiibacter sp. KMU-158]|uniref:Rieske 2Fe-2S domain-containing protein n=1 Tax=Spongiibacter pelagi TaxID=2760804 RepID=A0A927C442_9GAMM|nr:Rieske 2Fe-2S domain-containing protein [Spongiibacter pelagi]MBD2859241.1 Rieske 2Fe-2S domain-containing protein [Spongiibacter pelagi]